MTPNPVGEPTALPEELPPEVWMAINEYASAYYDFVKNPEWSANRRFAWNFSPEGFGFSNPAKK